MSVESEKKKLGREPFQLAELELGGCALRNGVGLCTASPDAGLECVNTFDTCQDTANFDRLAGTQFTTDDDRLVLDATLNGIPNSPRGTLVIAFKYDNDDLPATSAARRCILDSIQCGIRVGRISSGGQDNLLFVEGHQDDGSSAFTLISDTPVLAADGWQLACMSWDLETVQSTFVINDAGRWGGFGITVPMVNYIDANEWTVGAGHRDGLGIWDGSIQPMEGCLAMVYFAPGQFIDFSTEAGRKSIYREVSQALYLGSQGERPTRSPASFYFWGNPPDFINNRGTAGAFTPQQADPVECADDTPWTAQTVRLYRFCDSVADLPARARAIPNIKRGGVQLASTVISPDRGLGQRASVTIQLRDLPFSDVGFDPYVMTRAAGVSEAATLMTKFVARNRSGLLGRRLRLMNGYVERDTVGDVPLALLDSNYDIRRYEIQTLEGPDSAGNFKLTAKDPLKRTSESKAQAPLANTGSLNAAIIASDTALVLKPLGVGDEEYKASGFVRIESEVIGFTRTGDNMVITRGEFGTLAVDHDVDASVQMCLQYVSKNIHDIVFDLLVNYSGVEASLIPYQDWKAECIAYLPRLYEVLITDPVGVDQLLKELTEQAPFNFWWDERGSLIRLRVLRPPGNAIPLYDVKSIVGGSVTVKERDDLRLTEVWVNFGPIDPTKKVDDTANYLQTHIDVAGEQESQPSYDQPVIQKINARWISNINKPAAVDAAAMRLQRFAKSPRELKFKLDAKEIIWVGDIFFVRHPAVVDYLGAPELLTMQASAVVENEAGHSLEFTALEFTALAQSTERLILVSSAFFNLIARDRHDLIYGAPTGPVDVIVRVESGGYLGSVDTLRYAFETGDFPVGSTLRFENYGQVAGAGGEGGAGETAHNPSGAPSITGLKGGSAMNITFPMTLMNLGIIGSGGGGGGGGCQSTGFISRDSGGGGGGGRGINALPSVGGPGGVGGASFTGNPGQPGVAGTFLAPGAGGAEGGRNAHGGGFGGDLAQPGTDGGTNGTFSGGVGGDPGDYAINGIANVTFDGAAGDIRGVQA